MSALEATPWTWATMPGIAADDGWRPRQQFLGAPEIAKLRAGFYGFGQDGFDTPTDVQWTSAIGPIEPPAQPGFPGTALNPAPRRHSLGRIGPLPFAPRTLGAGDSMAWRYLREIPALLRASDLPVLRFPAMTAAQMQADQTLAGTTGLTLARSRELEAAGYPERWRGPLPAFAELADQLHHFLTRSDTVTLPGGEVLPGAGRVIDELALYLQAAQIAQLPHSAVNNPVFRDALLNTYKLAWLVQHLRQGHGDAVRRVTHTGHWADNAWLYSDEATPLTASGWHPGYRADFVPGPEIARDVAQLQRAIAGELGELRAELREHVTPGTLVVPPGLSPATPADARWTVTATFAVAAAGLVYWKWGRARGRRAGKTPAHAPQGARTMALLQ